MCLHDAIVFCGSGSGHILHFQHFYQVLHGFKVGQITFVYGIKTKPRRDVGKSYLASALGHQACLQGHRTLYFNTQKLFPQLKMFKADGSYLRQLDKIEKYDLLILDDFGLQPLDNEARMILLEIIEDRHGRKSTIVASQLPVAKWYEIIGDSTVADAILDRMIHSAHRIELKGNSLRKSKLN